MYYNVFIIYEMSSLFGTAVARRLIELLPCSMANLDLQHGSNTTWFWTSLYFRAQVEFNSINLFRHGSSTTFETGLTKVIFEIQYPF